MDVSSKSSSSRSITVHWLWVSELTPLPGIYFGAEKIVDLLERNAFQGWCFQPYEVMAIWSLTFLGFLCSPSLISPQGVFERRDWKCIPELLPLLFLSKGSPFAERINHHCAQTWTKPAGEEAHLLVDRGMLILSIRKYWEAHLLAVHSLILALSTIKVMLEFSTCLNLVFYFSIGSEYGQKKSGVDYWFPTNSNRYLASGRFPLTENMFSHCFLFPFQVYQ